jgi:hypothetical protein
VRIVRINGARSHCARCRRQCVKLTLGGAPGEIVGKCHGDKERRVLTGNTVEQMAELTRPWFGGEK